MPRSNLLGATSSRGKATAGAATPRRQGELKEGEEKGSGGGERGGGMGRRASGGPGGVTTMATGAGTPAWARGGGATAWRQWP